MKNNMKNLIKTTFALLALVLVIVGPKAAFAANGEDYYADYGGYGDYGSGYADYGGYGDYGGYADYGGYGDYGGYDSYADYGGYGDYGYDSYADYGGYGDYGGYDSYADYGGYGDYSGYDTAYSDYGGYGDYTGYDTAYDAYGGYDTAYDVGYTGYGGGYGSSGGYGSYMPYGQSSCPGGCSSGGGGSLGLNLSNRTSTVDNHARDSHNTNVDSHNNTNYTNTTTNTRIDTTNTCSNGDYNCNTVTTTNHIAQTPPPAPVPPVIYNNLTVTCPTSGNYSVNQQVSWYANAYGGNGSYTYYWTGAVNGYGNPLTASYSYPGTQYATVRVTDSTGKTATQSCQIVIGAIYTNYGGSTTYTNPGSGVLTSGVLLSSIPYTGFAENVKMGAFVLGMILWSAFVAWIIMRKRLAKKGITASSMIAKFKADNLANKQIAA